MSGYPHSYYVRTASAFRKMRHLLVKGILPQAILEYLKVYYAVVMANKRFASIANVRHHCRSAAMQP